MQNYNSKFKIHLTIFLIIVFLGLAGFLWLNNNEIGNPLAQALAQCLAEKQVTMYGADWCPHCQNEKKAFGDSFKIVPYVECPADPKRCLAVGVEAYPTWIFPDGKKLVGEQGIDKLVQESGCAINN